MTKILLSIALLFLLSELNAQNTTKNKITTNSFDEQTLKEKMKADGLSEPMINKLIEQRKELMKSGRNVIWTNLKKNPSTNAACNLGVESGWSSWQGAIGSNSGANPPIFGAAGAPASPNFVITNGSGIDANTPGPNPGDPKIPFVCPSFGNHSIQIGDICNAGSVCEQLTYPLTVTAADTNFLFAYAMVIENAGHLPTESPFVSFNMYDQNANVIPCASLTYTGGPNIPGFYYVSGTSCAYGGTDEYKPWTIAGVNLAPYIGQIVNVVITNADCVYGGHFAYSYWDFSCGNSQPAYCNGQQIALCATIPALYQWYHNGNIMTGDTTQCISVIPTWGDVFSVQINQGTGCKFYQTFSPVDTCATAVNEITGIESISVSPNPTSENLFIDFENKNFGKAEISFSDVVGRILFETSIPASGKQILDVSEFSEGIYFLKLKTEAEAAEITKKIIITKK